MIFEWLPVVGLAALAWLWWDGLQKREIALHAVQQACARANVQLLDDSVSLRRLRARRDENQRVGLYREYAFEYSAAGDDRQAGRVYLLGARVLSIDLIQLRAV